MKTSTIDTIIQELSKKLFTNDEKYVIIIM